MGSVANGKCFKLRVLQIAGVANYNCCKVQVLQKLPKVAKSHQQLPKVAISELGYGRTTARTGARMDRWVS